MHLGIDADTLQMGAIAVIANKVGNSPIAVELMEQTPSLGAAINFTGNGAYDTQDVHEACYRRGTIPITTARKGARLRKGLAFTHCHEAMKARQRLERAIWKR